MPPKQYNLTQLAERIKVHRLTIYYWIKKDWIRPRRDYRGYPVFTETDVKKIVQWHKKLQ
ncbi:MAG: hypothetical protein A2Z83_09050 [Omnitrophica bacterium GWA2_52_8]|nr:MAG: hypothetical protein A2Z83_09050 [Omnitrophica bacterium GWA2_52_8]